MFFCRANERRHLAEILEEHKTLTAGKDSEMKEKQMKLEKLVIYKFD